MMNKKDEAVSTERALKLALDYLLSKQTGAHIIAAIREALASEAKEQPAQQEPAGAVYRYGKDSSGKPWHGIRWTASGLDLPDGTLIYTSPPAQRKPLTDEEWQSIADTLGCFITRGQKDAIEAALGIKGDASEQGGRNDL